MWPEICASVLSGIVEVTASHPLDYLKTRIQDAAQTQSRTIHPWRFTYETYMREGIPIFYTGYGIRLFFIIPIRILYWGPMAQFQKWTHQWALPPWAQASLIGTGVGVIQSLADNPAEALKVRHMTTDKSQREPVLKMFRQLKFPGFSATASRNSVFGVGMTYAFLHKKHEDPMYNFWLCGGAGVLSSLVSQPLDYIKTDFQRSTSGGHTLPPWQNGWHLLRTEPLRLMEGGLMRASLSFMNMGFGGVTFIWIYHHLIQWSEDD